MPYRDRSVKDFGECKISDDNFRVKVPGSCVAGGGRTGYSVKIISRDALFNGKFRIGGPDVVGSIQNKPPQGW